MKNRLAVVVACAFAAVLCTGCGRTMHATRGMVTVPGKMVAEATKGIAGGTRDVATGVWICTEKIGKGIVFGGQDIATGAARGVWKIGQGVSLDPLRTVHGVNGGVEEIGKGVWKGTEKIGKGTFGGVGAAAKGSFKGVGSVFNGTVGVATQPVVRGISDIVEKRNDTTETVEAKPEAIPEAESWNTRPAEGI